MQTISADDFKKKYGEVALNQLAPTLGQPKPGIVGRVGADINNRGANIVDAIQGDGKYAGESAIRRGTEATAEAFNAIPATAMNALPDAVRNPLAKVGEAVGGVVNKLADKVSDSEKLQEWTVNHPDASKALEEILGTTSAAGQISGDILLADQVSKGLQKGVDKAGQGVKKIGDETDVLSKQLKESAMSKTNNQPAQIMQRVARISKQKQAKFQQMSGESVGEYLTKRGIYGNVDDISEQLYKRFNQSKGAADDALAKLPGKYDPAPVKTALTELYERELRVSTPGAPSPVLGEVQGLMSKSQGGWTMSEINQIKRLYERNVKVDYLRSNLPESVARANNLDSAIRNWQFKQAETLGLKNLPAINKETQLAKQLLNDLGVEHAGQAGNNAISLTDWIMLSGGDPTAIAGFIVKKTFSSDTVKAAIVKALNKGKPVLGDVKADLGPSKVLQLPAGTTKGKVNNVPIRLGGPSTMEKQAPNLGKVNGTVRQTVSGDKIGRMKITPSNIDKSFGTFNPYKGLTSKEELMRVLKEKPAFIDDSYGGDISPAAIQKFANKHKLYYGKVVLNVGPKTYRGKPNLTQVVAKNKKTFDAIANAKNDKELGIALGYKELK